MGQNNQIEPLFRRKLELLADHVVSGVTATLITSFALVALLWNISDHNKLLGWLSVVVILGCLRYAHIFYYKNSAKDSLNSKTWRLLFYMSFALSGLLWGLSIVLLAPSDNLIYLGANTFWVCAIVATAIGSYSFLNRVYFLFSASACFPSILYLLTLSQNHSLSIALAAVSYTHLTLPTTPYV